MSRLDRWQDTNAEITLSRWNKERYYFRFQYRILTLTWSELKVVQKFTNQTVFTNVHDLTKHERLTQLVMTTWPQIKRDNSYKNAGQHRWQWDTGGNHQDVKQEEEGKYKTIQEVKMREREALNMNMTWNFTDFKQWDWNKTGSSRWDQTWAT